MQAIWAPVDSFHHFMNPLQISQLQLLEAYINEIRKANIERDVVTSRSAILIL